MLTPWPVALPWGPTTEDLSPREPGRPFSCDGHWSAGANSVQETLGGEHLSSVLTQMNSNNYKKKSLYYRISHSLEFADGIPRV